MVVANLKKAKALQDQAALSLFTMPMDAQLTEEAREYLNLRRQEEMERLKRRMEAVQRAAKLEAMAHDRLVKERSAEVARATKSRGTPPAMTPIAPEMSPPIRIRLQFPSTPLPLPHPAAATPVGTGKFGTFEFLSMSTNFLITSFHCVLRFRLVRVSGSCISFIFFSPLHSFNSPLNLHCTCQFMISAPASSQSHEFIF